ncbi:HAD family hydrolase [Paenibacillus arenilitoris]|uniref:Haloacid dehalogenase n=1 Tax=Paenibacillus arenilitoris TaxID=2772299 RepID=A0A927CNA3_9BACL|nr:haloacid dehalogenase [Paenibacillus arenilitoris]MBD2871213.1 haloacid dehalogenase [Paenibacillus arenilitoris]
MSRPQLVLDIGGVLAANLTPRFWRLAAVEAAVAEQALYRAYKEEMSDRLWTGAISEERFWAWMRSYAPALTDEKARGFIDDSLEPLPALGRLREWSAAADLHVLSNHLRSWVEPVIGPYADVWTSVTISSEVGCRKPHPEIFARVTPHLPPGSAVLFVDDQDKNLRQAALLGWRTLRADEEGAWIEQVLPMLREDRQRPASKEEGT